MPTPTPTPAPSTEQLALSAALFTSAIDAWIPPAFGPRPSEADQAASFDQRLRHAALLGAHERLGAGHPDQGAPKPRGPSLGALQRTLGKVDRKGKHSAEREAALPPPAPRPADSDDEESRTRSVGRKKAHPVADLLRGKKSKKGKEPAAAASPIAHPSASGSDAKNDETAAGGDETPTTRPSSPARPGAFPLPGPLALESPRAQPQALERPTRKRPRESAEIDAPGPILRLEPDAGARAAGPSQSPEDRGDGDSESQGDAKLSKTQRRRDARKRARLARQE